MAGGAKEEGREFRDYKGRKLQQEPLPPNEKLGFLDKGMGLDDKHYTDKAGRAMPQAARFQRSFGTFARGQAGAWMFALAAGGIALGVWKMMQPGSPKNQPQAQTKQI